jgi:DNA-binding transcriptional LysR family regulator
MPDHGAFICVSPILTICWEKFKLFPRVKLVIRSYSSFKVAEDVLNYQVDLGVVVSMDYANPSVEKAVAGGRLKVLPLSGEIWVGVDALLRADAPGHPMAEKFLSLVREAFETKHHRTAAGTVAK